jgi:hypothetical protein
MAGAFITTKLNAVEVQGRFQDIFLLEKVIQKVFSGLLNFIFYEIGIGSIKICLKMV